MQRRYDIDWLRIIATFGMFSRHCARFFNYGGWHIKNNELSFGLSLFVSFLDQWVMPLFFVLAAISTYYALSHLSNFRYIHERFLRLIIPLLPGVLMLIPIQYYIESVSNFRFSGSYLDFLPGYLKNSADNLLYGNLAHLWFLEVLFIFSVLALPIFRFIRGEVFQRFFTSCAKFIGKPGVVFLLAIPVVVMEVVVNSHPYPIIGRTFGSWSLFTYFGFFMLGYLLALDTQFRLAVESQRKAALVLAILSTFVGIIWFLSNYGNFSFPPIFRVLNTWFWLVALLGFGSKYLNYPNDFQKYANEAVLPFYILHQTVIVMIAYGMVSWDISVMGKFLLLSIMSFIVILGIYHFGIRQILVLRFLFGMKSKERPRLVLA